MKMLDRKPEINTFTVAGKNVVLTGGLGRLGREFTRALLVEGARVAILDKAKAPAGLVRQLGEATSENFVCLQADITRRASLERAAEKIIRQWKKVDGLINNAGVDAPPHSGDGKNRNFETYTEKEWDRVMDTNAKGVFLASQVFGSRMAKAQGGSIINISSIYGLVSPDQRIYANSKKKAFVKPVAYSASKSALVNLTRYLATYWADKNVRVNTLTFGGVLDGQDKTFVKNYCARVPMGRMARPNEYNGAVLFLLSEASSYMTGANLVLDGGWTAW